MVCHLSFVVPICHAKLRREQKELNICGPNAMPSFLREFLLFGTLSSLLQSCLASKVYCVCVSFFFFFLRKALLRVWEVIMTCSQKQKTHLQLLQRSVSEWGKSVSLCSSSLFPPSKGCWLSVKYTCTEKSIFVQTCTPLP